MNNLQVLGKFLDQPMLVSKFQKAMPAILTTGAAAYTIYDASKEPDKDKRKKRALRTGITLGVTAASAIAAPHIASAITKRSLGASINTIKENNTQLIDTFVKTTKLDEKTSAILEKSKDKVLKFNEVKTLFSEVKKKAGGKDFLEKLIPSPENISAKDIFSEIGYLSIFGAVPVLGGITGGIISDKVTDKKHWKEKIPDKIKEGSYQYLANIFMCNVGAGIALGILEKMGITSKAARAAGMTAGIVSTGIIGGSKIANLISDKVIEPIFTPKHKHHKKRDHSAENPINKDLHKKHKHKERTPEILDIGLHTDDIATVSLLSGLKWIEPALPLMYTLSGYRAGIGYRN